MDVPSIAPITDDPTPTDQQGESPKLGLHTAIDTATAAHATDDTVTAASATTTPAIAAAEDITGLHSPSITAYVEKVTGAAEDTIHGDENNQVKAFGVGAIIGICVVSVILVAVAGIGYWKHNKAKYSQRLSDTASKNAIAVVQEGSTVSPSHATVTTTNFVRMV